MKAPKTLTRVITLFAISIGLVLILMAVQVLNNAPNSQPVVGLIASPANELVGTHQPSPYDEDADLDCWPRQYPTPTSGPNTEPIGIPICDREQSIAGEIVVYPPARNPTAEAATLVAEMTRMADINPNVISLMRDWEITPGFDPEWAALLASDQVPDRVYGILQFQYPIDFGIHEKTLALEGLGVEFKFGQPSPGTIWYVIIPRTALPVIYDWVSRGELRYAGPIPPHARIHPEVWAMAEAAPNDPLPVTVRLFEAPPSGDLPHFYFGAVYYGEQTLDETVAGWIYPEDLAAFAQVPQVRFVALRPTELCTSVGFNEPNCRIDPTPSR